MASLPSPGLRRISRLVSVVALIGLSGMGFANPSGVPDVTKGEKPTGPSPKAKDILVSNLGPTGLLGWVYQRGSSTAESRQILITKVMPGSPADGVIKEGDVILGASGSSAKPGLFTADARKSFGLAIGEAEARNPATLSMQVWRAGKTLTASIQLETMGAYSATAPYDCPKTRRILEKTLVYLDGHELKRDNFGLNILPLLACNDESLPGNAERLKRADEWIVELIPDRATLDLMTSDRVETGSKVAWRRVYMLLVLAEYHLATGKNPSKDGIDLLTAIDAHAQTVARGQSMFGTMGHQFAMQGSDGSIHGPYAVGYGPINSVGLVALVGLNLARDCKLPNPKTRAAIDEGIERAGRFFSFYVGRGSIPYGEHPPYDSHASNGKNGMAAFAFSRMPEGEQQAKYFAKVSIAEAPHRDGGHGGAFFSYLWSPLGSAVGGKEAAVAHFKQVGWHLDLARTWQGGFYYNDFGRSGYNGPTFGKAGLYMSTPALMTYALGLNKLTLTGRDVRPSSFLSAAEVEEALRAASYQPKARSLEELIADFGSFSAQVRNQAAVEFVARPEAQDWRVKLEAMAANSNHASQLGAIKALGLLAKPESAPVLIGLLDQPRDLVREAAVDAIAAMPREIQVTHVDTLLKAAAALRRPPLEVHPQDPVNSTLVALTEILFGNEGVLAKGLQSVESHSSRKQLHEAIRAVATLPSGGQRGKLKSVFDWLSAEDVKALGDTLIELIYVEAPADAMFAESIRSSSVSLLLKHHFKEGLQASVDLYKVGGLWTRVLLIRDWAKLGPALTGTPQAAEITELIKQFDHPKYKGEAQKALAAIAKKSESAVRFVPLK